MSDFGIPCYPEIRAAESRPPYRDKVSDDVKVRDHRIRALEAALRGLSAIVRSELEESSGTGRRYFENTYGEALLKAEALLAAVKEVQIVLPNCEN